MLNITTTTVENPTVHKLHLLKMRLFEILYFIFRSDEEGIRISLMCTTEPYLGYVCEGRPTFAN